MSLPGCGEISKQRSNSINRKGGNVDANDYAKISSATFDSAEKIIAEHLKVFRQG